MWQFVMLRVTQSFSFLLWWKLCQSACPNLRPELARDKNAYGIVIGQPMLDAIFYHDSTADLRTIHYGELGHES